jgi:5-methylcytosine-specific restriction endonuclease McrA
MAVFVLDKKGKPLMSCTERRARIHKLKPVTIRLNDRLVEDSVLQPIACKIDPGSKETGIALVREDENHETVIGLIEVSHRGHQISEDLSARRSMRRSRRQRNTRFRKPRFLNRGNKASGWLPPSLEHRMQTTTNIVKRLQKMQKADIAGTEYQQGTLAGFEVKEYVLEKFNRQCMYCDAQDTPLEVEHIVPKSRGGSNRISNLGLACRPCNQKKGSKDLKDFVQNPIRYQRIVAQLKTPLKDAASVNSTRHALLKVLNTLGVPVLGSTGAQTKWNRKQQGITKTHALDAVCVGKIGNIRNWQQPTLRIKCMGRGSYQRTRLNQYGFPRGYLMRVKSIHGFMTGDMVKANV